MENYNRLFLLDDSDMNDAERIEFIRSSGETPDYEDYIKADTERKPGHINLSQIDESRGFIKMEGLKNFEAPIYNLENGEFEVGNLFDFVHDIALGDQLSDIQEDALTEIDIKNYIAKLHATEPSKYEHTISEYTEDQYEYTELISPASAEEFIVAHNIADGKQDEFVFSVREELESISEVKFVLYNGVVVEAFQVNEYEGDNQFIGMITVSIIDDSTGLRVVALEGARISIYGTTFKLPSLGNEIVHAKTAMQSIEDGAQAILDTYTAALQAEKVAAEDAAQVAQGEVEMIENQVIENKLASEKQHAELRASRNEDSECGIQSKTKKDGQGVFKKLINSWKKLHPIYKPTDSGETNPKEELRFEAPSKRSSKGDKKTYDKVLNSTIGYRSSVEDSYDGMKLQRYYCDEFGKFTEGDASERWDIVKPCLVVGTTIVGKAYFTTTVEELEKKGGQAALDIYNDSDFHSRKKDGRTISGMYRYFKPSYYGLEGFIDEYGYSDIVGAKNALLAQRDGLSGSKLAGEVRKFPFTAKEAFYSAVGTQVFPAHKLYEQKEFNETLRSSVIRKGNFVWDDMSNHKVSFHDDPEGFFEMSWMPHAEARNNFSYDGRGFPAPNNHNTGIIACDPFDHKETVANKKSDAAAAGFKKFDINNPTNSNCFFLNYVGRRPDPDLFYEDMIMAGVFFGLKIFCENQKPGLLNHMRRRGYHNYIHTTKQSDYTQSSSKTKVEGVSMSGNLVRQQAVNGLISYIHKFVGKISRDVQKEEYGWSGKDLRDDLYGTCPFDSQIDDWLKFDANNWTVFDQTVACMIAILGVTAVRKQTRVQEEKAIDLSLSSLVSLHKLR